MYINKQKQNWSTNTDTRNSLVCDAMSRNRFEEILSCVHLAHTKENENDRAWKIRPMIKICQEKFSHYLQMEENLSIDESMIKYYGRHPSKQFVKGKPIRYGFKAWLLCSSSGKCHMFSLYMGAGDRQEGLGLGEAVVLSFADRVPEGCTFYFDQYFSKIRLHQMLADRRIASVGTIQMNRLRGAGKLLDDKKELNKLPRGETTCVSTDTVTVVVWKDTKPVTMSSNYFGSGAKSKCTRWDKTKKAQIQVSRPEIVKKYNCHMGGVDLTEEFVNQYRIRIRNRRWYFCIFTWLMDLLMTNSWLLFRENVHNITQFEFRRQVVLSLLNKSLQYKKPKVISSTDHSVTCDPMKRRIRCKVCRSQTVFRCSTCDVALHANTCFLRFHKK